MYTIMSALSYAKETIADCIPFSGPALLGGHSHASWSSSVVSCLCKESCASYFRKANKPAHSIELTAIAQTC